MITPYLEKMIHEGIASARTFVCGMSGSNVLSVPKNAYIVIHNLIYFPFYNTPENADGKYNAKVVQNINKQLQLKSQQTDNHFIIRDSGLDVFVPVNIETYLVHNSDVAITFLAQPTIEKANINFNIQKVSSVVRPFRTGYGNLNAVLEINLDAIANMRYQPPQAINTGVAVSASYRNEYKLDHTPQTQLLDPNQAQQGQLLDRSLPLLNVQYILINKPPTDRTQASS